MECCLLHRVLRKINCATIINMLGDSEHKWQRQYGTAFLITFLCNNFIKLHCTISPSCRATETLVISRGTSLFFMLSFLGSVDSSDSPLVRHLLISWRPALQPSLLARDLIVRAYLVDKDPSWRGFAATFDVVTSYCRSTIFCRWLPWQLAPVAKDVADNWCSWCSRYNCEGKAVDFIA